MTSRKTGSDFDFDPDADADPDPDTDNYFCSLPLCLWMLSYRVLNCQLAA